MDQYNNQNNNNQNPEISDQYEPVIPVEFNTNYAPSPEPGFSLSLSLSDLKSLTGWATFRAIIDIIVGALSCLGIITAAYGVPQIIAGVKLLNAVDELKRYIAAADAQRISLALGSLQRYFKLGGIATIVKIVFGILFIILYIGVIAYVISQNGNLFQDFSNMQNF